MDGASAVTAATPSLAAGEKDLGAALASVTAELEESCAPGDA